jgi:hypothetical protein
MKYQLAAAFGLFLLNYSLGNAQGENDGCYRLWAKAFEVRGSEEVRDGWHEDVIISIRKGSKEDCFYGKVKVEDGAVKMIFLKFVDGLYEPYVPKWKYEQKVSITNGVSRTLPTVDDELVNVLFLKHLKPKKQSYERVPLPELDDY